MFEGRELARKHAVALPQRFDLSLRLLASPVKAAGSEGVMRAQVAPAVGHAEAVPRLPCQSHLHGNRTRERHRSTHRLEAGGQARVGREPAPRSDGGSSGE